MTAKKYNRVFVRLTDETLKALEARRKRERRRTLADCARAIVEAALEEEADKIKLATGPE
jgi:hypothetical protein